MSGSTSEHKQPPTQSFPYGGARAIKNPEVVNYIKDFTNAKNFVHDSLNDTSIIHKFSTAFKDWIQQSELNDLNGLLRFPYACYSLGITQSLDIFYMENRHCRFRCLKGEYKYNEVTWRNNFPGWKYIGDADLEAGDALVISVPFSDLGNKHPSTDDLISECNKKNIPVFIDCEFFGICQNIQFDFDQPCIKGIGFSLSKVFPVAYARIGLRLSRTDNDDPLFFLQKADGIGYANRLGAAIGFELIQKFSPDYNVNKYKDLQKLHCKNLDLEISDSVIFGLSSNQYDEYRRGNDWSRLCLNFLYEGD